MKANSKIAVIDYGLGNLHSLLKALKRFHPAVEATEEPAVAAAADALVLPGVGAFGAGMEGLKIRGLAETVRRFTLGGRPVLGICLGVQLLFSKGYEFGEFDGLGIIPGRVVKLPKLADGVKIPHIGWAPILPPATAIWSGTVLENLAPRSYMYFVHSFVPEPENRENVLAVSSCGGHEFAAVVRKGNVFGCQFHPEKSGEAGLKIIENFVGLAKSS